MMRTWDSRTDDQKQKDYDGQLAAVERMGQLMGFEDQAPVTTDKALDVVGWMQWNPATLKGTNHRCIHCQPKRPGKGHWEEVTRGRLAATMACTTCLVKLELVTLP